MSTTGLPALTTGWGRPAWVVAVAVAGLMVLCASASASTVEIKGGSIEERFVVRSDQGGGCTFDIFVDVPVVAGVTTYTAYVTDTVFKQTAANPGQYSTSPPYANDHIVFGPGVGFEAHAGQHQIPLAGGSGGVGVKGKTCEGATGEPGRFTLLKVVGVGDLHKLTIRTLDQQLNGIPNRNVQIAGAGQSTTTVSTVSTGTVTVEEPAGDYKVEPVPADGTFKPLASTDCNVTGLACSVHLEHDASVAFQAPRDRFEFHFTPASLAADGLGFYTGEVDDLDPTGAPAAGVSIKFTPPVETPKALVCSSTGRLYPQLLGSAVVFHPFRSITQEGKADFTVHVGTEAGSWLLEAEELNKMVPATGSISLPFTPQPRRLPADASQRLYDLLASLPTGQRIEVLHMSGDPAADQVVLLAFLGTELGALPTNFGPIHAGSHAGIEFYDETAATAVLDTKLANEIADAALNRQPLPADAIHLPTLAQYETAVGPATRGTLAPQPEGELTYFGFPYPPLSQNGQADAAFYDQCLRPDALYFRVEVHSPVRLLFTDSKGLRFGLNASGKAVSGAPGLLLTDATHHTTTYVLPAGGYRVALAGTGSGPASIVAFTPGSSKMRGQVVSFHVRKGQAGSAMLTGGGLGGSVSFAGHRYRVAAGVGVRIRLSPARLRHGRGTRAVKVLVTDQFGRALPSAPVSVLKGKTTIAAVLTDTHGAVTVLVPTAQKGQVVVRATAAAARSASIKLKIA